jgi:VIT1/CCC1 family predicted Fe2+/Mn2+ transporter
MSVLRERLLEPIDRISEVLFGLIMAVTIVGSQSITSSDQSVARAVTHAAFGCNLAWGLVDAVMYLLRTATERTHNYALAKQIVAADTRTACRLISDALPPHVANITGPKELDGMRRRLATLPARKHALGTRDYLEAIGVFLLVVVATFPVVLPFLLTSNLTIAKTGSRATALVMLFAAGVGLGRYAGYRRPFFTGFVMATIGVILIGAVIALGG